MGETLIKCCCSQKNESLIIGNDYHNTKEVSVQTDPPGTNIDDDMNLNKIYVDNLKKYPNIVKKSDLVEQKMQICENYDTIICEYPITNINIINSNVNVDVVNNGKKTNINISLVRDDFCKNLIKNINEIRTNPKSFIKTINESKKNIIEEDDKFYYKQNNVKNKIRLKEGQKSFDEAIDYLQNLESMDKLNFDNNLNIPRPKSKEELKDTHYLKNMVDNLIKKGIRIKCYWKIDDINIQDVCLLMMILDENNENKEIRNALLNKNMNKIGINSFTIDNTFACYILLSDR